jgi:hypothetical protein
MRTSALAHSRENTMKVITVILAASVALLAAGSSHAKVIGVRDGDYYHMPMLLTNEPCQGPHQDILGRRAILLRSNYGNAPLAACWYRDNGAVTVCEREGGRTDGNVTVNIGCYRRPESEFIDPASLPRGAF